MNNKYSKRKLTGLCLFLITLCSVQNAVAETANWSDSNYWGGNIPSAGQDVTIPAGDSVYLDTSTADLGDLTVEGELIFRDKDVNLTTDNLYIKGGLLQIGTKASPFVSNTSITINGKQETETFEGHASNGRHFLVGTGGVVEIHGKRAESTQWTQITSSIPAGSTTINLATNVDWKAGDKIVIAPSGYDFNESEKVTVTAVSNNEVTFTPALKYAHFGEQITVDGKTIDMRAEVGLITRNIVIKAPDSTFNSSSKDFKFGFHGMFLHGSDIHVEGVELVNGGQTGLKARYPFHWHHAHRASGDFIRNSSVHNSHQRAIVVHRTQGVLVESNVMFNIKDHAIVFSEDGDEIDNSFLDNLVVKVVKKEREEMAFPIKGHFISSQAENRRGGFWGRNYNNTFIGNHIAGVQSGMGFFFDDLNKPVSLDVITDMESRLVFKDNLVHSIEPVESKVYYGPQASGHALMLGRYGAGQGSEGKGKGDITFDSLTAYKVHGFGAWIENEKHTLKNAKFAQTSVGVFVRRSSLIDNFYLGNTKNKIGGGAQPAQIGNQPTGYGIVVKNGVPNSYPTLVNNTFHSMTTAAVGIIKGGLEPLNSNLVMTNVGARLINTPRIADITRTKYNRELTLPGLPTSYPLGSVPSNNGVLVDADGSLKGDGLPAYYSFSKLPSTVGNSILEWDAELKKEKRGDDLFKIYGTYYYTAMKGVTPVATQPPVVEEPPVVEPTAVPTSVPTAVPTIEEPAPVPTVPPVVDPVPTIVVPELEFRTLSDIKSSIEFALSLFDKVSKNQSVSKRSKCRKTRSGCKKRSRRRSTRSSRSLRTNYVTDDSELILDIVTKSIAGLEAIKEVNSIKSSSTRRAINSSIRKLGVILNAKKFSARRTYKSLSKLKIFKISLEEQQPGPDSEPTPIPTQEPAPTATPVVDIEPTAVPIPNPTLPPSTGDELPTGFLQNLNGKKIMAIGDSITEGGEYLKTYRYYLDSMIKETGINVNWVGAFDGIHTNRSGAVTNPAGWDSDHSGVGGITAEGLIPLISNSIATEKADVALIHLGTNDMACCNGVVYENTINGITQIISKLRAANNDVTIFLAQIIPANRNKGDRVVVLNSMYAELADALSTPSSQVVIVDHWTGFEPFISADKIHPNTEGYKEIGRRWFEAMK